MRRTFTRAWEVSIAGSGGAPLVPCSNSSSASLGRRRQRLTRKKRTNRSKGPFNRPIAGSFWGSSTLRWHPLGTLGFLLTRRQRAATIIVLRRRAMFSRLGSYSETEKSTRRGPGPAILPIIVRLSSALVGENAQELLLRSTVLSSTTTSSPFVIPSCQI
ncbi:hypothetical protein VUR80DRAFT_7108 [Thermomyces stellatus]